MYKTLEEKQCEKIKLLVEEFSGLKDIGVKSMGANIPDLKKIYCKLCKTYTKASYKVMATTLRHGYNHSSALVAVKKFDDYFENDQIYRIDVFHSVAKVLDSMHKQIDKEEETFKLIKKYTAFLNWFRTEVKETTPVDSSFFVGKYFSITNKY